MLKDTFYPLTSNVTKTLRQAKLTAAEWRIWSRLVEVDPWGDRYKDINTLEIMQECEVSKATFYRAIAKFEELEIFDFQDNGFSIRNLYGVSSLKNETRFSEMRQDSQICENSLKNETRFSEMRQDSQICENQAPEPALGNDSESAQILKTIQDHLDQQQKEPAVDLRKFEEVKKIIDQLKLIKCTPGLQINKQVEQAIADFLPNAQDAIAYLKECLKTWDGRRTYNWTGVLVKALKEGQKPNFPVHTQGGLLEIPPIPEELKKWFETVDQKRFNIFYSETRHSWMAVNKTGHAKQLFWQDAIIQWRKE